MTLEKGESIPSTHFRSGGDDDPGGPRRGPGGNGGRKPPPLMTPRPLKTLAFWLMMTVVVLLAVNFYHLSQPEERKLIYLAPGGAIGGGNIKSIKIADRDVQGELRTAIVDDSSGRSETIKRFLTILPMEPASFVDSVRAQNAGVTIEGARNAPMVHRGADLSAGPAHRGVLDLPVPPDAVRRQQGVQLWQEQSQAADREHAQDHLCRRGRRG